MEKFESVFDRWERRELSQAEAAEILGRSERQFRRYIDFYRDEGLEGLRDGRPGRHHFQCLGDVLAELAQVGRPAVRTDAGARMRRARAADATATDGGPVCPELKDLGAQLLAAVSGRVLLRALQSRLRFWSAPPARRVRRVAVRADRA